MWPTVVQKKYKLVNCFIKFYTKKMVEFYTARPQILCFYFTPNENMSLTDSVKRVQCKSETGD